MNSPVCLFCPKFRFSKKLTGILRRVYSNSTSSAWKSTIGLEVHAQLSAASKLFSPSGTQFASTANSNVSLFDAAIPGTLPVLNRKCVELAVLTSLALACRLNSVSLFDRKHYFYSDLPTGYQITQQRRPIAEGGSISFHVHTSDGQKAPYLKTSKIKQIQLEQDSGKSLHNEAAGTSLIDLNRAGIALIELVFEPDLTDGEEAASLVKELCLILQAVGSCSCKMEEGALRVDANVSVHKEGGPLGTRTEIKNIGSIRGIANAVKYEAERQIALLERGEVVVNETRAWDPTKKRTTLMRDKEEKQDYRYMPEPNLPPLMLRCEDTTGEGDTFVLDVRDWKDRIPELPEETRSNLIHKYGLLEIHAITLVNQPELHTYFKTIMAEKSGRDPRKVYKLLLQELLGALNHAEIDIQACPLKESRLGEVVDLMQNGKINAQTSRKILCEMLAGSQLTPAQFVEQNNLEQISDPTEIEKLCVGVLEECPKEVAAYRRGGKKQARVFNKLLAILKARTNDRANERTAINTMRTLLQSSSDFVAGK